MTPWTVLNPQPDNNDVPINQALQEGSVFLKGGWFQTRNTITVPYGRQLLALGNSTSIRKAFHGDLIKLQTATTLRDFYIDTTDPSWTGGGIVIDGQHTNQSISNVNGTANEFVLKVPNADSGAFLRVRDCDWMVGDPNRYAVQLPLAQDGIGGGIRFFENVNFGGRWGIDFGGASSTTVFNCNATGWKFRDETRRVQFLYSRIAMSGPCEVRGTYILMQNNLCQFPLQIMPGLNNSDIYQHLGAGVDCSQFPEYAAANVRLHDSLIVSCGNF